MLSYRAWLETRWRFVIGLAVTSCAGVLLVSMYPRLLLLLPDLPSMTANSELGRQIAESAELLGRYDGYVWQQGFDKNLLQLWTLFAMLLGTGGMLSQASGGAVLFTLSLPITRRRLVWSRAGVAALELLVIAVVPAILISLTSAGIGQSYPVRAALVHATCLCLGGLVFYALTAYFSTIFADVWRPFLATLVIQGLIVLIASAIRTGMLTLSPFAVMSGETYFRTGAIPWAGLALWSIVTVALLQATVINVERRDF